MNKVQVIDGFEYSVSEMLNEYYGSVLTKLQRAGKHRNVNVRSSILHYNFIRKGIKAINLPYTESVVERFFSEHIRLPDVTYRILMPNTSYTWHVDVSQIKCSYHMVLTSNLGCHFIYKNECYEMDVGKLYRVNNSISHTFVNSGEEPRVHLLFEKLDYDVFV